MAVLINKGFKERFLGLAPLILLYFLCITETDTKFTNHFEILSFELQLIIIYYWKLKNPSLLGNGHIFLAGIINDVITGLPMCTSAIIYLIVSLVASYIKNITVNTSLFSDWFTFIIALFFSQLVYITLISNFTEINFTYTDIFYTSFFTFLFYPLFWVIFNQYKSIILGKKDE